MAGVLKPELQDAAVLAPVYRGSDGDLRLVFIRRAAGGIHGGQIAFPGGKHDETDASMLDTALREADEEIGLARERVHVLETLAIFETRTTGFRIAPFLARITPPAAWRPRAGEVEEVLEVRLADLTDPAARGESMERFPDWPEPVRIEFFRIGPHRLWGATYRIVLPLLPRLAAGEWTF